MLSAVKENSNTNRSRSSRCHFINAQRPLVRIKALHSSNWRSNEIFSLSILTFCSHCSAIRTTSFLFLVILIINLSPIKKNSRRLCKRWSFQSWSWSQTLTPLRSPSRLKLCESAARQEVHLTFKRLKYAQCETCSRRTLTFAASRTVSAWSLEDHFNVASFQLCLWTLNIVVLSIGSLMWRRNNWPR